jgi:adenosine deaminase
MRADAQVTEDDIAFYARVPKVHLHSHILGMVAPATVLDLAQKYGADLGTDDPARLYIYYDFGGLVDLLSKIASVMREEADFSRVIYEAVKAGYQQDRVLYAELFIQTTYHFLFGVRYPTMLAGFADGLKRAERDFGVRTRLIAGLNRQLPPEIATHVVREVVANPSPYVIGIGLEDYEAAGPPEWFAAAYRLAENRGLHRTAHAGEHGPAENVVRALTVLKCERIDHGYQVGMDPALAYRLAENGVHFTTCPTVAGRQGWARDDGHILKRMRDRGLWISINADDPAIIGTTLSREYAIAAKAMGVTRAEMIALGLRAIDATWQSAAEKDELRRRFTVELATLPASDVSKS